MNTSKIILSLFFILSVCSSLFSQKFAQTDLQRLLMSHPLMKQYDPQTGRFKGTPSEIRQITDLKREKLLIAGKLKALKDERLLYLQTSLFSGSTTDDNIWDSLKETDERIEEQEIKLVNIEVLISSNGIPELKTLLTVSREISEDILKAEDDDIILLNKLPKSFSTQSPEIGDRDLRNFFWTGNQEILASYVENINVIGLLFLKVDDPILYEKKR